MWRQAGIECYLTTPARQNYLFRALTDLLGSGVGELAAQPLTTALPAQLRRDFSGRVLLAEDNVVNQLVAQTVLEGLGLDVLTVSDGRAAVNEMCLRGGDFELVLMDCEMPELDGRAATVAIRAFETANDRPR